MPLSTFYPQIGHHTTTNNPYQQIPGMSLNMPLGLIQPQQPNNEIKEMHEMHSK